MLAKNNIDFFTLVCYNEHNYVYMSLFFFEEKNITKWNNR